MQFTCDLYLVLYIEDYLQPASCHVVKYVMISVRGDTYMATLFGGETWDLFWEFGQAKS